MSHPGIFTISLDFELHWGCFENMMLEKPQQQYFNNTREIIPQKLALFAENGIHVTWATVGMLFLKNTDEWKLNKPAITPAFDNPNVSAYEWINRHGFYSEKDPFHFAPELVSLIKQTPNQELATHTYAHYFCLEKGQTAEQFKADLETACRLAAAQGTALKSLVFPRNQFNKEYLSICNDVGISSIRSSPDIWYWEPATSSSFMKKLFRAGDAYLKFQPIRMVYLKDFKKEPGMPISLPATRLYRPWKKGQPLQNKLKMRRILNEMTEAAKKRAYYHIWWHPHNFGNNPKECFEELKVIIRHFRMLNSKYQFTSLTMEETANLILERDGISAQ